MENTTYNGENLFGNELSHDITQFAKKTANDLCIHSSDDVDHWVQFKDKCDVNIWQDPDEKILRAAAYPLTGTDEDGWDTDTSKWQRIFAVENRCHDYYEPAFKF